MNDELACLAIADGAREVHCQKGLCGEGCSTGQQYARVLGVAPGCADQGRMWCANCHRTSAVAAAA